MVAFRLCSVAGHIWHLRWCVEGLAIAWKFWVCEDLSADYSLCAAQIICKQGMQQLVSEDAGAVVGAVLGVCVLLSCVMLMFWRRHKRLSKVRTFTMPSCNTISPVQKARIRACVLSFVVSAFRYEAN